MCVCFVGPRRRSSIANAEKKRAARAAADAAAQAKGKIDVKGRKARTI